MTTDPAATCSRPSVAVLVLCLALPGCGSEAPSASIDIDTATAAARVDERFLSVAVDTSQVVGGVFWDPEGATAVLGGVEVDPYDFRRPRLRNMAAPLAPAILRIGGSEADVAFYDLSDEPVSEPPEGYDQILTRAQLDGVFDFATELGFDVFFTLNAGPGPRDEDGHFVADQARLLVEYASAVDAPIVAWEFGNEINGFPLLHGLNLSGEEYAADTRTLRAMLQEVDPHTPLAAPSSAFWPEVGEFREMIEPFLAAGGGNDVDLLTWHYYPQQSLRCPVRSRPAESGVLLDPVNLDEIDSWSDQVQDIRDRLAPDLPIWLGETGNAQCGGEPGVSDAFEGSFWWVDQLGKMARAGQPVVVRQTLSGSNYGLIDDGTLEPRPDYFVSLLWRELMGTTVLDASSDDPLVRSYAHCARGREGSVAVVLANLDGMSARRIDFGAAAELFLLEAESLGSTRIALNGIELRVAEDGTPPELSSAHIGGGFDLPPHSIAFAVIDGAAAPACAR